MSLKNKNVVVVGGSSGIGLALVKHLAIQGANIFNISRNPATDWREGVTQMVALVT